MISSRQLMQLTGTTYRQVDHWSRVGYLAAVDARPGSGTTRWHDEREIPVALLLRALGDADMLGSAQGKGRGRKTDYLPLLIDHVRAHGLVGDWDITDALTLHLDSIGVRFAHA